MNIHLLNTSINDEVAHKYNAKITQIISGTAQKAHQSDGMGDGDIYICDLGNIQGDLVVKLHQNKHIISQRVLNGGFLLCFTGPIHNHGNNNNYNWINHLGPDLKPENLRGDTMTFTSDFEYLKQISNINFSYSTIFNDTFSDDFKVICHNKSNSPLGFYLKRTDGHLLILPRPSSINDFIDAFLKVLPEKFNINFKYPNVVEEKLPVFLKTLNVPGQESISAEITTQREIIKSAENKIITLQESYDRLNNWKALLYATDVQLENIVKKFFTEHFQLQLEKQDCDLVGKYNEKEVYIEIKGKKGCINEKNDFRQILQRKMVDSDDPDNTIALLIGNPFRHNELNKRPPTENQDLFAKKLIPKAEKVNIGLIHTLELYNILCDILDNKPANKEKILENIMNSSGIYKYQP